MSDRAFTRNRSLNFPTLILYLLNLRKHANQVELDQFFKAINGNNEATQQITKSAFFQARKQLSPTAFIDINHQLIDTIYDTSQHYKTWKGFRLCAIDGSSIRLPSEADIIYYFGVQKGRATQGDCPIGMASVFYDLLNHLAIDASINPRGTSERMCAQQHLAYAGDNDLIIYDRGYNAFWLYALHIQHNHAFCMRARTNKDLVVKDFIASNKKEAVVTFTPNKTTINSCRQKGLPTTPIKLRLIRVELDHEVEVLITNLMDSDKYPAHIFRSLYHLRWGIEENYKRLKQWVEIENFSGKSSLSVQQDFHAKIVAANLTALMALGAQQITTKKTKDLKRNYQINFAQALSKMKHRIVHLVLHAHSDIRLSIERTLRYISRTVEAVRTGRSTPRKLKNIKNDIHYPAYKSAL